ncbi:hypothetical protein [Amycolatopsis sp. 195334CR]|uniref:hypothetical protein n=1 Tax=Amycolatopsis sp. 195334CR TaxID=2814588 RepID=UPI001A8CD0F0|nr:hypothetical protein [Amycolatopsis sp. 195334CR]MBN6040593.1 hypothetical protein [Amycolatopsis sp. 195334CR]
MGKKMRAAVTTAAFALSVFSGMAGATAASAGEAGIQECGGTAAAPPGFWGPDTNSSCGSSGYPGYNKNYTWNVVNGDVTVCVQGWGFNSSGAGGWYDLGCGQSGSANVPWGYVLATGKIRAQSVQLPFAGMVHFKG